MQDSQDNEKQKTIKIDRQSAISDFIFAKFVSGCPCASPYMLFYMHGSDESRGGGGHSGRPPPIFVKYFKKSP